MGEFRAGNSRVLIATDVWGRGKPFLTILRSRCLASVLSNQLRSPIDKRALHPSNWSIR